MRKGGEPSSWSGRGHFSGRGLSLLGKIWVHLIKGTCCLGRTLPDIWPSKSREDSIKAQGIMDSRCTDKKKTGLVAVHTREMAITWINAFQFSIWKIKGQKWSLFVVVFGLVAINVPFNNHTTNVFRPTEYISSAMTCATQSAFKIELLKWHMSSGKLWPPLQERMDTTLLTEESKNLKATHYP